MSLRQKVQDVDKHGPECPCVPARLESSWSRLLSNPRASQLDCGRTKILLQSVGSDPPPAEANPDPLGDLAGLPVDCSCRNPLQSTGILLWLRENQEPPEKEQQRRANFTASWGKEEKGSSQGMLLLPLQHNAPHSVGLAKEVVCCRSPRHRPQACSCKRISGTPRDPSQLFPGMGEKVEKRGRGLLCPGSPRSGSSQSSEKSLRAGCLLWVTGESQWLQPCPSAEQTACNQSMLG